MQKNTLRLNEGDNVLTAIEQLMPGDEVHGIRVQGLIPPGHKLAACTIPAGNPVFRYGQVIGTASCDIPAGQHVHVHNLHMADLRHDYEFCTRTKDLPIDPDRDTFLGIRRPGSRVATRNYIGILTTVNCSATVARAVADHFRRDINPTALEDFPNVDGVVALTHSTGCGMAAQGEAIDTLRRTLAGYARHANFHSVLLIGLGCETNQITLMLEEHAMETGARIRQMSTQGIGGTRKTIEAAISAVEDLLGVANEDRRSPQPLSELVVALQCGGSDAYSGISANPALGYASDLLVRHGATAILSETPEIYGAEHLLTRRAADAGIAEALLARIDWWKHYTSRNNAELDNNPSHGNKEGGLTTILEKSLGAVAKGGTSRLNAVYEFAQPVTAHGLVFMDTPGNDPVAVTGQVAGGANLVCFTTGRGSTSGFKPAPCIKIASNTPMYERMSDDIDINCGDIVSGDETISEAGARIFELVVRIASGEHTKSEDFGYGDNEFVPWVVGAVM
mgnify:CR=1 FL=1